MREKLLKILNKNEYISGEKISSELGISRTAVWKQIEKLRKLGYNIKSVKNKGYLLVSKPDIPLSEELYNKIDTKIIGKKILYFKSLDSTNTYMKNNLIDKKKEGTIVIADIQKKGRGRKKRQWHSSSGGLWFSLILYPDLSPQKAMFVTMATSVSIAESIENFLNLKNEIKWPNDILINKKKVCGVLTELDAELDKLNYVIIGIGINVNNEIKKELTEIATCLKKEKKKYISRVDFLSDIIINLDKNYKLLKNGNLNKIKEKWLLYSKIIGKKITIKEGKSVLYGTVLDIDENGCLLLETKKGLKRIVSGDINYN